MPLNPLSSRQSTVAYAVDLLRAHQIRRENVFLHEQLKTCLREIAGLREEVRAIKANDITATIQNEVNDLRASINADKSSVQKALTLVSKHEDILNEQSREIEAVQNSYKCMQSDISDVETSVKAHDEVGSRMVLLEKQMQ